MVKIIALADSKTLYNLEELQKELFGQVSKENETKTYRLILNASRLNLIKIKINQRNKTVQFLEVNTHVMDQKKL